MSVACRRARESGKVEGHMHRETSVLERGQHESIETSVVGGRTSIDTSSALFGFTAIPDPVRIAF